MDKTIKKIEINEINCKSILNKSRIPDLDYTINPYTGCLHGCIYCYANAEKSNAEAAFRQHDEHSVLLGKAKEVADRWASGFFLTG